MECGYDSQGRRYFKKVTVAGTTTLHHRYIYRGYLQIAALDLTRSAHPALWLVTWDPSQPTATRPLAIQKDGTWFTYGYDLTKNICEVFGPAGYIRTTYSYAPFGSVTASGDVTQPFQWSSEHYDSELDLVYYNYRHYSPSLGRFLSRDPIEEQGGRNLYVFVGNSVLLKFDYCGNMISKISGEYSSLTPIFSAEDSVFPMGEMARVKVEDKTRLSIDVLKSAWVIFSNHTYILKSEGSLTLSLIWRREKKALFDDKKSSLNVHEKKHFEDYKKIYNEMIEEFNSYDEKTLCAKKVPCRQEVREYSQALRSFYLLKADFAAAVFHSTAESGYSDEMRNAELALKRRQDLPSTIKNYGDYVVYLQNRIMADATNVEELKKSLDKCINENQ